MPSFRSSSSRIHLERWVAQAASSVPANSLVLDAGSGDSPYAKLFEAHRYESADFAQLDKPYAPDLTYVCDLAHLPVEDERFDLVVMTQVLEHVPDPLSVLSEMHRVLKPGGELWYSAPLFYEEHEQPFDFYRYTQFAHRHLCAGAGLHLISIDWLEGYLATVAYELNMAASSLVVGRGGERRASITIRTLATRGVAAALKLLARQLDQRDARHRVTNVGMPKNYRVRAIRPLADH